MLIMTIIKIFSLLTITLNQLDNNEDKKNVASKLHYQCHHYNKENCIIMMQFVILKIIMFMIMIDIDHHDEVCC